MKDGDKLIKQLNQAVKVRNLIRVIKLDPEYKPPWWYFEDYLRANKN